MVCPGGVGVAQIYYPETYCCPKLLSSTLFVFVDGSRSDVEMKGRKGKGRGDRWQTYAYEMIWEWEDEQGITYMSSPLISDTSNSRPIIPRRKSKVHIMIIWATRPSPSPSSVKSVNVLKLKLFSSTGSEKADEPPPPDDDEPPPPPPPQPRESRESRRRRPPSPSPPAYEMNMNRTHL